MLNDQQEVASIDLKKYPKGSFTVDLKRVGNVLKVYLRIQPIEAEKAAV